MYTPYLTDILGRGAYLKNLSKAATLLPWPREVVGILSRFTNTEHRETPELDRGFPTRLVALLAFTCLSLALPFRPQSIAVPSRPTQVVLVPVPSARLTNLLALTPSRPYGHLAYV